MPWRRIPLVPPTIAFGGGIVLGDLVATPYLWWAWAGGLAAGALGLCLGRLHVAAALLLTGVVAIGALRAAPLDLAPDDVARLALPRSATVIARIEAEPTRFAPDRTRLVLRVERVDEAARSGRLQVTVYGPGPELGEGQRVRAEVKLHRATGYRNPGGFDYARHLEREGILVVGSVPAERIVVVDDPAPPWHLRVRRGARAVIEGALPPASAALLTGLLLGERTALPPDIDAGFRRAGVYHVLAVSGFNVALIAGATFALLSLVRLPRRAAAAVAIVVVAGFATVVGFQPSVLRAVIMATLVLGALLLEREASVLNGLALAALLILTLRPGDLYDPGFQLSFAATAGIVLAPLPRGLITGAVGVSLAAEIVILPITLAHFNQLSIVGPLANLGAVPLAGMATIVGLAAVAIAWLTTAGAELLLNATWPLLIALRALVTTVAAPPWALVHLPAPPTTAVTSYAAGLLLALVWWRLRPERPRPARAIGIAAVAALVTALLLEAWPLVRPSDGRLRVIVLDVGQGDAIVVETPRGAAFLVDAGPGGPSRLDVGERVVAPVLWNRGILRLAGAVATHDDRDHAGGLQAIRRLFPLGCGWSVDDLRRAPRIVGGVRLTALAAPDPAPGRRPTRNDDALVLRLDYGLVSFLLASDITAATEKRLVASGAPLAATVLKVAHHGSRDSSTPPFLRAVRPLVAVVSVGPRNPYGHPSSQTLERLAAVGAAVYRTDRDGAVILETDGRQVTATRWASRHADRYCLDPESVC